MKRILITGSEGMIGRELYNLLHKDKNNDILCADLKLCQDLRDYETCLKLCNGMEEVYHLAGVKGSPKRTSERPADFFAPMIQFNTNMLEAARICGVRRFLYTSSIAVDNMETDYYPAWAKLTGEKQIETYRIQYPRGMQCCIVRPANVYGKYDNFDNPYAMVITSLIVKALKPGKYLEVWGDGTQVRDFVNAKDVAMGMIKAMQVMPPLPINLCSGKGITIKKVAEIIVSETNKELIFDLTKPRGAEIRIMTFNGNLIGWKPIVDMEEGIKDIFNNIKIKIEA